MTPKHQISLFEHWEIHFLFDDDCNEFIKLSTIFKTLHVYFNFKTILSEFVWLMSVMLALYSYWLKHWIRSTQILNSYWSIIGLNFSHEILLVKQTQLPFSHWINFQLALWLEQTKIMDNQNMFDDHKTFIKFLTIFKHTIKSRIFTSSFLIANLFYNWQRIIKAILINYQIGYFLNWMYFSN